MLLISIHSSSASNHWSEVSKFQPAICCNAVCCHMMYICIYEFLKRHFLQCCMFFYIRDRLDFYCWYQYIHQVPLLTGQECLIFNEAYFRMIRVVINVADGIPFLDINIHQASLLTNQTYPISIASLAETVYVLIYMIARIYFVDFNIHQAL